MSQAKRILVGQSGGPTSAINASLAGVIAGAREKGAHAIGMRYGIQGFLDGRTVDLDQAVPDDDALSLLRDTPASWLGSCRFKLPEPEVDPEFFARALGRIDAAGVSAVLYIGGNDSAGGKRRPLRRRSQDHRQRPRRHGPHARLRKRGPLRGDGRRGGYARRGRLRPQERDLRRDHGPRRRLARGLRLPRQPRRGAAARGASGRGCAHGKGRGTSRREEHRHGRDV